MQRVMNGVTIKCNKSPLKRQSIYTHSLLFMLCTKRDSWKLKNTHKEFNGKMVLETYVIKRVKNKNAKLVWLSEWNE